MNRATNHYSRTTKYGFAVIVIIFIVAIVWRHFLLVHNDVSWLLYVTAQYVSGAKLYEDVVILNPPLIVWLSTPSVWFANVFNLPMVPVFKIYVFSIIAPTIWISWRLVEILKLKHGVVIIAAATFILTIYPGSAFGQREHFMMILCWPYLLLIAARRDDKIMPRGLIIAATLMGMLAFAIKPHFVLVPVLLEFYLLVTIGVRKTVLRIEPFVLGAGACLYIVLVFLFTPEYFSKIIHYGMEVYGAGYSRPLSSFIFKDRFLILTLLLFLICAFIIQRKKMPPVVAVFAISTLCMFAAFALQSKGWYYHGLPGRSLLLMSIVLCLTPLFTKSARLLESIVIATLAICMVLLCARPLEKSGFPRNTLDQWEAEIAKYPGTDSILIMSANVYNGFPLVTENNLTWGSRFACYWLTPGLQAREKMLGGKTPLLKKIEAYNRQLAAEDISRTQPDLIFVDVSDDKKHFNGIQFDYIEDFSNDELFRQVWQGYQKVGHAHNFDIYKFNEQKE